jgi:microcystin-dependent protein
MAKITRVTHKVFGGSGATSYFAKFGSLQAGTPVKSKDIATIQSLSAWDNGLQDAIYAANKAPLLEDLNALFLAHSTQVAYILQEGLPEWDAGTTYFENSKVKLPLSLGGSVGAPQEFVSLQDNNVGHTPPVGSSDAWWAWVNPPVVTPTAVPPGSIVPFGGIVLPSQYIWCDGAAYDGGLGTYAALYAAIGTAWGNGGGGANMFNAPDLRGVGLRGNNSYGVGDVADAYADPDKLTRGARKAGGATGNAIGTFQLDQFASHTHAIYDPLAGADTNSGGPNYNAASNLVTTQATGGNETRMKNAAVGFIIKL